MTIIKVPEADEIVAPVLSTIANLPTFGLL
jgi:hypothetical protein